VTVKPIVPGDLARQDIDDAIDYYGYEAGTDIARDFVADLNETYQKIAELPSVGSPRCAHHLNLPGLRSRKLKRFLHVIFYFEQTDRIAVWRILHGSRDMAASLMVEDD
jgi:toxin ParE1/3/4